MFSPQRKKKIEHEGFKIILNYYPNSTWKKCTVVSSGRISFLTTQEAPREASYPACRAVTLLSEELLQLQLHPPLGARTPTFSSVAPSPRATLRASKCRRHFGQAAKGGGGARCDRLASPRGGARQLPAKLKNGKAVPLEKACWSLADFTTTRSVAGCLQRPGGCV